MACAREGLPVNGYGLRRSGLRTSSPYAL